MPSLWQQGVSFHQLLQLELAIITLQSRTGPVQSRNRVFPVYFFSQGKPCFHYRGTLFSLQGPCFHYRDFPVRKSTQGKPCFHYMEWVCSVVYKQNLVKLSTYWELKPWSNFGIGIGVETFFDKISLLVVKLLKLRQLYLDYYWL